ncbi:MAG: Peptide deformylase [Parcubacteria group bacterium GW2011_GWC2_42_12]|uniref:Peptide deformylase n=1 Tax=Candidatus Falkowbacteria bacterium GW2011_GWA2_41_14 TaxID=1618635 RepID=A0A0G0X3Y5_9BACT|nr:MAG: Peptide deformylase [Candidatus Falkowbacteria bacterium GW2011_GWA2_41_14]KKS35233.1 MAG: Peptide deformylase [Parcubacteria group bacterium GW2011_GWC2_42_12]HBC44488.1 peptide deformylase [Candidatus Vogelbacteria bacterium]
MPILKIITIPNPILRKKSKEINFKEINTRDFAKLVSAMGKTMIKTDGAGLAAPQIGKSIRLAVINSKDGPICLINPKITRKSWARELGQEGCLSIPGIFGQVKRHKKITVAYYNQAGKKIKQVAQGLMARVMQHEIDHLDGILFIDKMAGKKIKQHE